MEFPPAVLLWRRRVVGVAGTEVSRDKPEGRLLSGQTGRFPPRPQEHDRAQEEHDGEEDHEWPAEVVEDRGQPHESRHFLFCQRAEDGR